MSEQLQDICIIFRPPDLPTDGDAVSAVKVSYRMCKTISEIYLLLLDTEKGALMAFDKPPIPHFDRDRGLFTIKGRCPQSSISYIQAEFARLLPRAWAESAIKDEANRLQHGQH